jgi:hypothetical protein
MNTDIVKDNFGVLKVKIKARWRALSEDEIDALQDHSENLARKLQECYGWEREEAERQVKEFRSLHHWH